MKSAEPRSHYSSPLREQQKNQTRSLILDATERLLDRTKGHRITIPDVARAARVTERTVYRHFSTREELLAACWRRVVRSMLPGREDWEVETVEQMLDMTQRALKAYNAHEGLVQAMVESPTGREGRKRPGLLILDRIRRSCEKIFPGNSPDTIRTVAAATYMIASVPSWAHLRFQFDLRGEEANEVVLRALDWMLKGARMRVKIFKKPDLKAVRRRGER